MSIFSFENTKKLKKESDSVVYTTQSMGVKEKPKGMRVTKLESEFFLLEEEKVALGFKDEQLYFNEEVVKTGEFFEVVTQGEFDLHVLLSKFKKSDSIFKEKEYTYMEKKLVKELTALSSYFKNDLEEKEFSQVEFTEENGEVMEILIPFEYAPTETPKIKEGILNTAPATNEEKVVEPVKEEKPKETKKYHGKPAEILLKDGSIHLEEIASTYYMPLIKKEKKPMLKWSLPEYRNTTQEPEWMLPFQKTGKFLATGKIAEGNLGIVVVDLDTNDSNEPIGEKNYFSFIKNHPGYSKEVEKELKTATVVSPSNGKHYYYYYDASKYELKNTASVLAPLVDTRAQGGIIVLPGTETQKGKYKILGDNFWVREIPEFLLKILLKAKKEKKVKHESKSRIKGSAPVKTSGSYESIEEPRFEKYRAKVWESIVEEAQSTQEGQRDNNLTALAFKAGSFGIEYYTAQELISIFEGLGLESEKVQETFERCFEEGRNNLNELEIMAPQESIMAQINEQEVKEIAPLTLETIADSVDSVDSENNENNGIIESIESELKAESKKSEEELEKEKARKRAIEKKLEKYTSRMWEEEIENLYARFITEKKSFIQWNDSKKVWEENENLGVLLRAFRKQKIAQIEKLCEKEGINERRVVSKMETDRFLDSGQRAVKEMHPVSVNELNGARDHFHILAKNGVVNLENGELLENEKLYLYTDILNASYTPYEELKGMTEYKEALQTWKKILDSLDTGTQKYLQRVLGGALTRKQTKTLRSFWWYSKGSSGKSTLANVLRAVFEGFGASPNQSVFMVNGDGFELSTLEGKRIGIIEEAPVGYLDSGRLKSVTGGNELGLRNLYEKSRKVKATWHLHIMTNHMPLIRSSEADLGTLRRITLIPFLKTYTSENGIDHTLLLAHEDSKVREVALAWLVEGAKEWIALPDGGESESYYSEEMVKMNEEFKESVKETSDPISSFIEESIVEDENYQIPAKEVFEGYQKWCKENNVNNKKTAQSFYREFETKIGKRFEDRTRAKGKKTSYYSYDFPESMSSDKQMKRIFGYKFL